MPSKPFARDALDYAREQLFAIDPHRIIGNRYWVEGDDGTSWIRVSAHEFTQNCQWYLLEHTQEAEEDHPASHYQLAATWVAGEIRKLTRMEGFKPPPSL